MATDSNNAALVDFIVLSPQWKVGARLAASDAYTGSKDTVAGVICLVIFIRADLSGFTRSRSPTGFERGAHRCGASPHRPDSIRKAAAL
jgi:hypothetical protein